MKAIIFDMDGTITDSEKYWSLTPFRLLEYLGIFEEKGMEAPWYSTSHMTSVKNYMEMYPGRITMTVKEAKNWCRDYMYTHIYPDKVALKPFAMDTMNAVKELGIPCCLLSATDRQPLFYTLCKLNLLPYFDFWETTCNAPLNKNHVELFEKAAARLGMKTSDCCVFEDSLYSMKTAKAAGCKVWAIADDKHVKSRDEIIALADRYFENHMEMSKAVREHFLAD